MPWSGAASTMRRIASTPASCPRRRDRPRRVAQRPLPSMMMPTWRLSRCLSDSLEENLLCITKLPSKKMTSSRQDAEPRQGALLLARRLGGVAHQPFQHGEIVEKAAAAGLGEAARRVGTVALIALGDLDQARLLQHLQMARQIAVGQPAELL